MDTTVEKKKKPLQNPGENLRKEFEKFVIKNNHPCVMAQTVFSMDHVDFHSLRGFRFGENRKKDPRAT